KKPAGGEPIKAANWGRWAGRLREWSGEHFQAASPAFSAAFNYIKGQHKLTGGDRLTLPKGLARDAVAWMALAGAYLHDSKPKLGPVAVARHAQQAAERAVRLDKGLARAHYYAYWARPHPQ